MIPEVLPAPNWWLALLYFVPTLAELYIVAVYWRRVPTYPEESQPKARSNVIGAFCMVLLVAAIVLQMIKIR